MLSIDMTASGGDLVGAVARDMVRLAHLLGCAVHVKLNGATLRANPRSTEREIVAEYGRKLRVMRLEIPPEVKP